MKTVIRVENVGKQYRLGEVGTGTISHDLNRWWARLRGREDPYSTIGEINDRTLKADGDYVWALQNINFEVRQGEVLGIIGRNGAGKSTLLKILSKVTKPTTGRILTKGRIASLLEVGTGFHPEMTGRENIFLNGAIMGMTKSEIKYKLDEIIDFAGVEKYIDTPVKRYSSGMYVRLAFAVAAHLNSEILIVDEVLAVGDAEFQKKCLGKMGDISKGEGRTVLFVSHNMASIEYLCTTAMLLRNGNLLNYGNKNLIIEEYRTMERKAINNIVIKDRTDRNGSGVVKITEFNYSIKESLQFTLKYEGKMSTAFTGKVYIAVYDTKENCVLFFDSSVINDIPSKFPSRGTIVINTSSEVSLVDQQYSVNVAILVDDEWVDHIVDALTIDTIDNDFYHTGKKLYHNPQVHISQNWKIS
jgi:lipopolysaccharide transport system ATP-binding protein